MSPLPSVRCKIPQEWLEALDSYASEQDLSREEVLKQAIAAFLQVDLPPEKANRFTVLEQEISDLKQLVVKLSDRLTLLENQKLVPLNSEEGSQKKDKVSGVIKGLEMRELCYLCKVNLEDVKYRSTRVGLSLETGLEIETGWLYDEETELFYPPSHRLDIA